MIKHTLLSVLLLTVAACATTAHDDNDSADITVRPEVITPQLKNGASGCGTCDAVLKDPPDWASICTLTKTECDEHGQLSCSYSCSRKRPATTSSTSSGGGGGGSSGVIQ
jgi:hypothetical protein